MRRRLGATSSVRQRSSPHQCRSLAVGPNLPCRFAITAPPLAPTRERAATGGDCCRFCPACCFLFESVPRALPPRARPDAAAPRPRPVRVATATAAAVAAVAAVFKMRVAVAERATACWLDANRLGCCFHSDCWDCCWLLSPRWYDFGRDSGSDSAFLASALVAAHTTRPLPSIKVASFTSCKDRSSSSPSSWQKCHNSSSSPSSGRYATIVPVTASHRGMLWRIAR